MLLLLGASFVVFAVASALALIAGALYRAPVGDECADGLHIRQRDQASSFPLGPSTVPADLDQLGASKSLKSARM